MAVREALVVEDDKAIAALVAEALTQAGFQVRVVGDGEAARQALLEVLPTVVVTDVLLPNLSGFELVEALRRMPGGAGVRVIMTSGIYRGLRHKQQAQALGVDAYFEKPFGVQALLVAVLETSSPNLRSAATTMPAAVFAMPMSGSLVPGTTALLLHAFKCTGRNGGLMLRQGQRKKIVYFGNGIPVAVKSNVEDECLGHVLVRQKMISPQQCERSLAKVRASGNRQGDVLVQMGCLSPQNLVFGLHMQLQTKLSDMLAWVEGEYQISDSVETPEFAVHLNGSYFEFMAEALDATASDAMVQAYLTAHTNDEVQVVAGRASAGVEPDSDAGVVYEWLLARGGAPPTAAQVLHSVELPRAATARALYLLALCDVVSMGRLQRGRA